MTEFNPFPQPAPDFSDPLGLLRACHGRIFAHCDTLQRLTSHLKTKGADNESIETMKRIHHYFATAAQHHHEDEELDLFPRLRGLSKEVDCLVTELEKEHRDLAERWQALSTYLQDPAATLSDLHAFTGTVNHFVMAYRAHATKENEGLLLLAPRLLKAEALQAIGAAMAARRNISH